MAIEKFSDIPNLFAYISAEESTINKTGNDVDSVVCDDSFEGGALTLSNVGVNRINHDPATIKIGQMAAFKPSVVASDPLLEGTAANSIPSDSDWTAVHVCQINDLTDSGRSICLSSGGTAEQYAHGYSSIHYVRIKNSTRNTDIAIETGTPLTIVTRWNNATGGTGIPETWINKVKSAELSSQVQMTSGLSKFSLCNNRNDTTRSWNGEVSIVAVYSRLLTDQEVSDVSDLCQTWVDTGAPPVTGPPTSGTFGTVITTDDPNAIFAWEESATGASWGPVGTILTDTSGANTATLTVNSADLSMNGTLVRCSVTAPYQSTPTITNTATLTVESA